jgi:Ring finger domain
MTIIMRRSYTRGFRNDLIGDKSRSLNASLTPKFMNSDAMNFSSEMSSGNSTLMVGNDSSEEVGKQSPFLFIIYALLFLCCCSCMRTQHSEEARRRLERYRRKAAYNPQDHRGDQIDKSLCVQRVVAVDAEGNVQLEDLETSDVPNVSDYSCDDEECLFNQDATKSQTSAVSEANESGDNLIACCCICLEPYRVGDVVAWSNNSSEECLHVFHRDCIYQWLENLKHDECPSCRTIILQPHDPFAEDLENEAGSQGRERTGDSPTDDGETSQSTRNNTGSVAYCIMQGLISRVRHARFSLIGQTISFDSEDSELQCTSYDNDVAPNSWISYPSPFRRVMSYGDHLFSKRRSAQWKSVETEEDHFVGVPVCRASTKLVSDPKLLLPQSYKMRRAISAGPCSPIFGKQDQQSKDSFLHHSIVESVGPSTSMDSEPSDLIIPFRRSSSLRLRLKYPDFRNLRSAASCSEDASGNHDASHLQFSTSLRKNSVNWASDVDLADCTDRTEEDDILIHKVS